MNLQRPTISIFGFLGGLICGLAISVAIALYLTNSPVPFVNKVQHATENVNPEPGDPNRPLFSPQIPAAGAADPAARPVPESNEPAGPVPGVATPPPPTAAAPAAPPGAGAGPAKPGAADAGADGGARLMLQVGAFKNADDADVLRARIALLGLDAKVTANLVDGATLYRVRLGPYGPLDDLNGIRRTLSENGMEPQLVHIK